MHIGAEQVMRKRNDLSRYMVHLTRDNKADFGKDGRSARGTFIAIWNSLKIRARKAHCLHRRRIKEQNVEYRDGNCKLIELLDAQKAYRERLGRVIQFESDYRRTLNKLNAAVGLKSYGPDNGATEAIDNGSDKKKD